MHAPITKLLRSKNQHNAITAIGQVYGNSAEHSADAADAIAIAQIRLTIGSCQSLAEMDSALNTIVTALGVSNNKMAKLCRHAAICVKTGIWYPSVRKLRKVLHTYANRVPKETAKNYPAVRRFLVHAL